MWQKLGQILSAPWFFRRVAMLWACYECHIIIRLTFTNLPIIDGVKGALIGGLFGVLAAVIGFYHKDRQADIDTVVKKYS
jgi:hypothetical protein